MISVYSDDFRSVQARYKLLPKKVEDGLVEILEDIFSKAERNAKRRAPKRTGALRGAIKHAVHRNHWNVRGVVYVDVEQLYGGKARGTLTSGKLDYYPAYVEYGTKTQDIGGKGRTGVRWPGSRAQPFLRPGRVYLKAKARRLINAKLQRLEGEG